MNTKYSIKCTVTGKDLVRTPKYLDQQCQKYGFESVEAFRNQYIGREARKLLKSGKSVDSIRQEFQCHINTPIQEETLVRFKIKKLSGTTNLRTPEKPRLKTDPNCPF